MLGWLEGWWYPQPTRVQVLVLAIFLDLFQDFRWCTFSGRRHSRQWRGAYGDFVNFKMIWRLSLLEVFIRIGCAFIEVCVCACIWALAFVLCFKKTISNGATGDYLKIHIFSTRSSLGFCTTKFKWVGPACPQRNQLNHVFFPKHIWIQGPQQNQLNIGLILYMTFYYQTTMSIYIVRPY